MYLAKNKQYGRLIKVLMLYDIKGWAWWHRIRNIAKNQPKDILIHYLALDVKFDHRSYDLVVIFESMFINSSFAGMKRKED